MAIDAQVKRRSKTSRQKRIRYPLENLNIRTQAAACNPTILGPSSMDVQALRIWGLGFGGWGLGGWDLGFNLPNSGFGERGRQSKNSSCNLSLQRR